jgi:RND family efflux transporter MFP subunit
MKLLRSRPFWLVLLLVLALAGTLAWHKQGNKPAGPAGATENASIELLAADVTRTEARALQRNLRVNGSLRAVSLATVKARAAGELRDLLVREGESVRAGQVLAHIEPTELNLRVLQATENVSAARGQLDIAKKNLDNSRTLFERGFISATSLQNAEAQTMTAQANVNANIAALNLTRKALADAEVRAPINGIIAARLVQTGERVALDTRLLDIVDISQLELEASVPATDIAQVRIGQAVSLKAEGVETPISGRIVRISPANQAGSRSFLVYAQIDNRDGRLRAGLFAEARITLETRPVALTVPGTAVRTLSNGNAMVYLIEQGKLVERAVRTGMTSDDNGGLIEVSEGLAAGDTVVRINLGALRSGSSVHIAAPARAGQER